MGEIEFYDFCERCRRGRQDKAAPGGLFRQPRDRRRAGGARTAQPSWREGIGKRS
jgi:hypothetical protein